MYTLKTKHVYYGQVQLGIFVNNLASTDFCIYSSYDNGMYIINIQKNEKFIHKMLTKLKHHFFEHMLHTICLSNNKEL